MDWALLAALPPMLSEPEIRASYLATDGQPPQSEYKWNGWSFEVAPGVFFPGSASRMAHERMVDGTIDVSGRRYAAMGSGLGVELVIAASRGATVVCGIDVDDGSVRLAELNYWRILGESAPPLIALASDLWDSAEGLGPFDVVTFNPPFSTVELEDPLARRMRAGGLALAKRFFEQTAQHCVLADGGAVYLTLANTEPMREILAIALEQGFSIERIDERVSRSSPVTTSIFALTLRESA